MPQRHQLSRRRGARKPSGVVSVARPTRWGNPYAVTPYMSATQAVDRYRRAIEDGWDGVPTIREIREHLAGRDLACWCSLDQPCHADVLLQIANAGQQIR